MVKLGGVRDGTVFCTVGLEVGTWTACDGFRRRGIFPNPNSGIDRARFELLNRRRTKQVVTPLMGTYTTANVWPLAGDNLVGNAGRWLYASSDGGYTWEPVHELPASSGPMGVLPTSLCETPDRVYLAEYPLGGERARVLASEDGGRTWSPYLVESDIRHFHGIHLDEYTGDVWATTGDADGECAIGRIDDGRFDPIGRGSQRWRAVGLAFTPNYLLWGVDCSYAETIPILRLSRGHLARDAPEPAVVGTTDCSVFYTASLEVGGEVWVLVATATETGIDSHAPPTKRRNTSGETARVLVSSADSAFERWYEVRSFGRRVTLGDLGRGLPTSNGYVFVDVDPDRGVVLNPYNTETMHGEIIEVHLDEFDRERLDRYEGDLPTDHEVVRNL